MVGIPCKQFVAGDSLKSKFKCKLCHLVLKDPKKFPKLNLGGYICVSCLPSSFSSEIPQPPPPDFVKSLESLNLHCSFQSSGCEFISTLGGMDAHEAECGFNEIDQDPPYFNAYAFSHAPIGKSVPDPGMSLSAASSILLVEVKRLRQDVEMYKNEVDAKDEITDGLSLKLKMQEIEIVSLRDKADAADLIQTTKDNKLAEAASATQVEFSASALLEICRLEAKLAIQKLESQLETQKLESQLTIQIQKLELQLQFQTQIQHSKSDAKFSKHLLDNARQMKKAALEMSQLKQQLADNEQVVEDLKKEVETNAVNAVNMKVRVTELTAELLPLKLQLADKNRQLDRVRNWGRGHKNRNYFDCLREYLQL